MLCKYYDNNKTQLSIKLNAGTTRGDSVVLIICIRPVFSITIQPNTNTLFSLLFEQNRIQIEHLVQRYLTLTSILENVNTNNLVFYIFLEFRSLHVTRRLAKQTQHVNRTAAKYAIGNLQIKQLRAKTINTMAQQI